MYVRIDQAFMAQMQQIFSPYMQADKSARELLLHYSLPSNLEKDSDRKFKRALQLQARNLVGINSKNFIYPYIRISGTKIEVLHGSGSLQGDSNLLSLLEIIYPRIFQLQVLRLDSIAAFRLNDFHAELYQVNLVDTLSLELFQLSEQHVQNLWKLPSSKQHLLLKVSNEQFDTQRLRNLHCKIFIQQLLQQQVAYKRLEKHNDQVLQNGVVSYLQSPVGDYDDLRMQANHYVQFGQGEAFAALGTKFTRLQGAATESGEGIAGAFCNGGIYCGFECDLLQLAELFS